MMHCRIKKPKQYKTNKQIKNPKKTFLVVHDGCTQWETVHLPPREPSKVRALQLLVLTEERKDYQEAETERWCL